MINKATWIGFMNKAIPTNNKNLDSDITVPANSKLFLLLSLVCIDLGFVGLHFYNSLIPDEQWNPLFSLVNDSSIAELFQYIKWFLIAALFVLIAIKRSTLNYLAWALVFTYFLLDDALEVHESMGGYLVQNASFTAPFGLRLQDIGELAVSALAGTILLVSLVWAYMKSDSIFKAISYNMLILIFALVCFGIGVDMLHEISHPERLLNFIFEVVEDGGEMFVASIMLWYVAILTTAKNGAISLIDSIRSIFQSK